MWCRSMCQNTLFAQGEQSLTPAQLKQMSVTALHFQMSEIVKVIELTWKHFFSKSL